jgi:hypothetical protein
VPVPVGGPAPGSGVPWVISYYTSIPAGNVNVVAESNKSLATVIAELRTEIANLKSRLTAGGIA